MSRGGVVKSNVTMGHAPEVLWQGYVGRGQGDPYIRIIKLDNGTTRVEIAIGRDSVSGNETWVPIDIISAQIKR